ncbi:hypothetical protein YP94_004457 [Salmonella enterica subsp. enterica]|nr:hypothetical protein [Salmonella enterica subsp. enterica]EBS4937812.1 hypothetical protein [Salmonella enterica subsp. enterica serovar Goverdhan]ECD5489174.1 hypothetical protein [Salmonella enterica subsp. enterica serovar Brijbhumi]EKO5069639.1 hypothetical protein [Salmonella enterica]EBU7062474.1 hypothetical protein [Salmonella enterica subsp. enterica serovar Goverdhan]
MKKVIISCLVLLALTGGMLWLAPHIAGTELSCRSGFEKNTVTGLHMRGVIAVHLFRDHTGVASMTGKIISAEGAWTLNRETGFHYEVPDARKGVFRIKKTYFRALSSDTLPAQYNHDTDMNTTAQDSDYMIIRKINKNTFLFSTPAVPVMLCVSE